jgi:hypothetical protein
MRAPALAELHEIFLGQAGGSLELVAGKHYRGDTANAEARKDGSLASAGGKWRRSGRSAPSCNRCTASRRRCCPSWRSRSVRIATPRCLTVSKRSRSSLLLKLQATSWAKASETVGLDCDCLSSQLRLTQKPPITLERMMSSFCPNSRSKLSCRL